MASTSGQRFPDGKPGVTYVEDDSQRRLREDMEKVVHEQEEWKRRCEGTALEGEAYVEEQRTRVPGEEEQQQKQHRTYVADDYTVQVHGDEDDYESDDEKERKRKVREAFHKDGRCWVFEDDGCHQFPFILGYYPEAMNYLHKLMDAYAKDDCIRFIELSREEQRVQTVRKAGVIFHPSLLLLITIHQGAIRCETSILDGSAGLLVDINLAPRHDDLPPIFKAATEFRPDMVDMLYNYGARFDIPCPAFGSFYRSLIPLQATVAAFIAEFLIKPNITWSTAQCPEELICFLGGHNTGRELLTISIVMRRTPIEQTQRAMIGYAQHLDAVALGLLLYVDATFEHLGIFKRFSRLEYFLLVNLVNLVGKFRCGRDLDIVRGQQLVNGMELLLKTFYEESFEAGIAATFKMARANFKVVEATSGFMEDGGI